MKSPDADFRYMALMDVSASLTQESYRYHPLEDSVESALVKQVLELVVDKNSEVKNLAVKTCVQRLTQPRHAVDARASGALSRDRVQPRAAGARAGRREPRHWGAG